MDTSRGQKNRLEYLLRAAIPTLRLPPTDPHSCLSETEFRHGLLAGLGGRKGAHPHPQVCGRDLRVVTQVWLSSQILSSSSAKGFIFLTAYAGQSIHLSLAFYR